MSLPRSESDPAPRLPFPEPPSHADAPCRLAAMGPRTAEPGTPRATAEPPGGGRPAAGIAELERALCAELRRAVRVRYGRSTSSPVVARPPTPAELAREPTLTGGLVVRLHQRFADAPQEVLAALGRWLRLGRRDRRACARLDRWIADEIPRRTAFPRAPHVAPRGEFHDLGELAGEVLSGELAWAFPTGCEPPRVTWGPRRRSRARHTLRLGSFEAARHLVRLHPVLDQAGVPRWFVRFVLFHELLHAALGPETAGTGRVLHHGPRFRAIERAHPDHGRAQRWERRHLGALLRSARGGRPLRPLGARGHR